MTAEKKPKTPNVAFELYIDCLQSGVSTKTSGKIFSIKQST